MSEALRGFAGKRLRVGISRKTAEEVLDIIVRKAYLQGSRYVAKVLLDELPAGTDPLGPANKLLFSTGPLSLNTVPGEGSVELWFKAPLTGGRGESRSGSDFGPDLRRAGFDHPIIEGCSDEPVYLVATEGGSQIPPATWRGRRCRRNGGFSNPSSRADRAR